MALFFFAINSFYGYAFYLGGYARWTDLKTSTGELVGSGVVMTCLFCFIFGSLALTTVAPNLTKMNEGKIAATMALEVIDHQPIIKQDEQGSTPVDKNNFKGEIVFENV